LVHGDEGKLRQVLINLLSNAVKFTGEGGVTLRISDSHDTQHVSLFTFAVIDTGVGIAPEDQAAILEPFTQGQASATQGGTGLGLAISQKLIAIMGGQLCLESEVGKASRFWFTVPLPPAQTEVPSPKAAVGRTVLHLAAGHSVKALVVDDVAENREVLSRILSDIGVQVTTVESGQGAIESVRADRSDIVFMDIRMPVMDGVETTMHLWEEFGRETMKIVAISASTLAHQQEEYRAAGFDAFISKPFLAERVYGGLETLLGVNYEYEAESESAVEAESLDFEGIEIPQDLLRRLKEAAEFYNITEIKKCLNDVTRLGAEGERLAAHLSSLLDDYDMEGMLALLSEIAASDE
jgi:CheY-like chemotaxis protein